MLHACWGEAGSESSPRRQIIKPPDSFFELVPERDRDVARRFYTKYLEVDGMPVVAAG